MGAKANPNGLRLKINKGWKSLWFDDKKYADQLIEDVSLRKRLTEELKSATISDVKIDRDANQITVAIYTSRPGVIIGRGGAGSEKIKKLVEKMTKSKARINIIEVKRPDGDAMYIAQNIASQIERRIAFRRAIKQAIEKGKESGVKGIKISVSGRLNGVDIARNEKASFGTVPLSTLKSDIDFVHVPAMTSYGIIGVKVWVYKGEKTEVFEETKERYNRK